MILMPWYWIVLIVTAIVGPFEAMYAWSRAKSVMSRKKKDGDQNPRP